MAYHSVILSMFFFKRALHGLKLLRFCQISTPIPRCSERQSDTKIQELWWGCGGWKAAEFPKQQWCLFEMFGIHELFRMWETFVSFV